MSSDGDNASDVPEDVRLLLFERIEGYEHLEMLLLLKGDPSRTWRSEEVATKLGVPADVAQAALESLTHHQLLSTDGAAQFRYGPRDAAVAASVEALASAYDESRLEIMQLMNRTAIQRVRTAAMRTFADAFLIRKKDG